MLMASLRDPYAAGVNMLAASQLAQLNHLMMQQQQQQPHSPSQAGNPLSLGGPPLGTPLGTPPECQSPPISRTYTYKKVTKPLLERKRRARINRCLDELKELMVGALEAEGENVSKLEKADILELTVRHLQRITKPRDIAEDASRFQAGFSQCASEACHFLLGLPGLDAAVGRRLVAHLSQVVAQVGVGQGLALRPPSIPTASTTTNAYSPPASPDQHPGQPQRHGRTLQGVAASPNPAAVHVHQPLPHLGGAFPRSPSGRGSPTDADAEGEVSSSTSTLSWTVRLGKRTRSPQGRSEADEDSDDDDDPDSDAPVNYTSEALRSQHHSKRPRYQSPDQGQGPDQGPLPPPGPPGRACGSTPVSSSRGSHSGSDMDDEDKGPMWRPW